MTLFHSRDREREREGERERDSRICAKDAIFMCTRKRRKESEGELDRELDSNKSQNKRYIERERERKFESCSCCLAPHFTNWYIMDLCTIIMQPVRAALNP
jgi:hypothetical protein